MLRCKQVTTIVAQDDLVDAGPWLRLRVRLHLLMCRHCARYAAQIRDLGLKMRERFRHEDEEFDTEELQRRILDSAARATDEQDSN